MSILGKELPKDGRAHLDHIVSAKEIEKDAKNHLHLSTEERADMATRDENLAWTESKINQSKGEKPMKEFLETEKKGQTNAERFEINEEDARRKDEKARKMIKKEVDTAAF